MGLAENLPAEAHIDRQPRCHSPVILKVGPPIRGRDVFAYREAVVGAVGPPEQCVGQNVPGRVAAGDVVGKLGGKASVEVEGSENIPLLAIRSPAPVLPAEFETMLLDVDQEVVGGVLRVERRRIFSTGRTASKRRVTRSREEGERETVLKSRIYQIGELVDGRAGNSEFLVQILGVLVVALGGKVCETAAEFIGAFGIERGVVVDRQLMSREERNIRGGRRKRQGRTRYAFFVAAGVSGEHPLI